MPIDFGGLTPLLQVFDMPSSLRFYRDVLGFEVVADSGGGDEADWVWLKRDRDHLMLNTAYEAPERPPSSDMRRVTAHGDTVLFFGSADLDALHEHLVDHEVDVEPPTVAPYGMRQLGLRDPDGFGLCFQHPVAEPEGDRWRMPR